MWFAGSSWYPREDKQQTRTRAELEKVSKKVVNCLDEKEAIELLSVLLVKEYWRDRELFIKHQKMCNEK
tara:strand:+ start:339 stop:545 length:207 start_codon:yes stop_codon:yes gene_type:complete